ncbi:MAG: L-aspartate oxidase [Hyphomicrobiales bacterium]|nr:L-aspartate oxidase [Hyphomicrobiales bacterium]
MKTGTLIIGAGLAGVCVALQARGPVLLLSPNRLGEGCASDWAQGGIAAAFDADDHPQAHARDTIEAGGGIVDAESARLLSESVADAVRDLADIGVPFDRNDGGFALGREAAHSRARIVRVGGDGAGHAIMEILVQALRRCKNVCVLEGVQARDLLLAQGRVAGVLARDGDGKAVRIRARRTVLACGGIGQLYRFTTNPAASRGEGIAMAARAGAVLSDMEFVQFHPTAIDTGGDPLPLATEALRGDGAVLLDRQGTRFLRRVHPSSELAPRDVVARAIQRERKLGPVFLDARGIKDLSARFPALLRACRGAGIDPCREAFPVLPAAHYHMGGIAIDANGRTSLPGLWACGEVASSGCHGANRLAGNSLGEAIVFAKRIARDRKDDGADFTRFDLPCIDDIPEDNGAEDKDIEQLRDLMSRRVGIERDESGLRFACGKLLQWKRKSRAGGRLSNMSTAALLIAVSALQRRESRGCHFRLDAAAATLPPRRSAITLAQAEDIAGQASSLPQEQPISL